MNIQIPVTAAGEPIVLPVTELYSLIMTTIEPELTVAGLQNLQKNLQNDTPATLGARAKRYEAAFKEYYTQLHAYNTAWEKLLYEYKKTTLQNLEVNDAQEDLQSIEALFV